MNCQIGGPFGDAFRAIKFDGIKATLAPVESPAPR